ncbi:MAG: carboxypeptidase regulatory-like domain-containing protein [Acidobacteria bacterium]|nr:carboxypeptidase regulatory-like domain-containing protein [Acidobacteriota bacterium]
MSKRWSSLLGSSFRPTQNFLLLAITVLALCASGFAQVRFGTLLGTVTDSSGATVSNANVKLTNLATNETRSTLTGGTGIFTFPNLIAGVYKVDVEMTGFKHFIQDKVEVQVDVTTRVDAALQVGSTGESVVVTSEAPPLQTDSASLGTVITQTAVESIPLSGRNVNNMLTLVPGVVAQGGTYGNAVSNQASGARTNAIGFGNYAIGGGFGNQSSFYIDGVPSNAPAGNVNALIPTQDAVQEFRVVTNNVAAEYGNYAGGIVNLTTKSGSNSFHGTAYEYLRNKVLNANDYFSNLNGLDRPHLAQNQFGGTVGGPVIKDKTFFFFSFERQVLKTATLVTNTVPTADQRAGDFSAAGLPAIYDPESPGTQFECDGTLNVICPDRLDSSALALFQKSYPLPNRPGLQNNFITQMSTGGINQQFNARVDHRISDKNNLFARYAYWKADSDAYDAWGTHTSGQGHTGIYTHSAILGDTHAFNPSTVLDLRLSYLRIFQHEFPDSQGVDLSQFGPGWAGLTSQLLAPANYPALAFSDGQGITGSNGIGSQLFWSQNVLTFSSNLTKLVGRHQIKMGGVVRRVQWISAPQNGVLTLNFDQAATANEGAGGSAVASALLGIVGAQGSQVASGMVGGSRAYFTSYGFFVDDTFQATRKLTITAGLRWDQPSTFSEASNNDTVFLPKAASPLGSFFNTVTGETQQLLGNVALVGSSDWKSQREDNLHWKLFSPRIGLAYRLTDKTVVRSAYGISYPPSTLSQDGPNLSPVNAAQGGGGPSATVADPFPLGLPQPKRRNVTPGDFYGLPIFAMRVPGDPTPYVQQWNAAVERQIGKDSSLTVAYAGSKGTHLLLQGWATVSNINLNQLPEQYFSMGPAALTEQVPNPFYGTITTPGALSGPTVNAGQLLLPFPQYGRVLFLDPHKGSSRYNSLQTSFLKRFGGKGILSVAYTYSRLTSNTDSSSAFLDEGFIFGGSTQDNNHLDREYSVSSYDVPHNLSVGYGLDLPFGRNQRFLRDAHGIANAIIGGWRINGITTFRSGVPMSVYQFFPGSALSLLGGGQGYFGAQGLWMRTDFDPTCKLGVSGSRQQRALNGWFNTSCFTPVDTSSEVRFGNEPRNVDGVRMDHMNNWDFSLSKRNNITERVYVQFTAEFFNAFNHVRFGAPDTNISDGPGRFGKITSQANPPRAIQFGLRVGF